MIFGGSLITLVSIILLSQSDFFLNFYQILAKKIIFYSAACQGERVVSLQV